jgi:hypothetical protein
MPHADQQIRKRLRSILVIVHDKNAARCGCHDLLVRKADACQENANPRCRNQAHFGQQLQAAL